MRNQILQPFGLSRLGGHGNALSQLTGSLTLTETGLDVAPVLQQGGMGYAFEGTYSLDGDPAGLEWRVGDSDWYPMQAVTAAGGTWTGTAAPPSGLYKQGVLQVRPTNPGTITPASSSMDVTVTDVFIIDGQSNADGHATNLQTYVKSNFDFLSGKEMDEFHITTSDPVGHSEGSAWPALAELLDQDGIPPAVFLPVTVDGTGFEDGAGPWSLTGNGASPGTSYNLHVSRVNSLVAKTGGVAALIWVQGEADTVTQAYADTWDTEFSAMIAQLRSDVPAYVGVPVIVSVVGEVGSGAFETEWRTSAYSVIDGDSLIHEGPNLVNEEYGDGTHYGRVGGSLDAAAAEAQLDRIAAMHKRVLDRVLYGSGDTGAARVSSYSYPADNVLRVTFDRAMANHSDATGWEVTDGGGPVPISSAAQGPTSASVDLTSSRDIYGSVTVSFGKAETASGGTLQDTDATAPMPPRVVTDADAGVGTGTAPVFADPSDQAATVEWWNAQSGITTDTESPPGVTDWASSLTGGTTLTQAALSLRPKTTVRTLNSIGIPDFDGTNDFVDYGTTSSILPTFALTQGSATGVYGRLEKCDGSAFTTATGTAVDRSGIGLWEIEFDATANTATLRLDGAQIAQAADYSGTGDAHIFIVADWQSTGVANRGLISNGWFGGTGNLRIGHGYNATCDGGIAEVVVCNAVLSGSNLTDMRSYLNTEWGL